MVKLFYFVHYMFQFQILSGSHPFLYSRDKYLLASATLVIFRLAASYFNVFPDFSATAYKLMASVIGPASVKLPGRFISAHLADWSSTTNKQVPVGQGIVDWKELFAAAKKCGVKNYFVEMDPETFKDSANYIRRL